MKTIGKSAQTSPKNLPEAFPYKPEISNQPVRRIDMDFVHLLLLAWIYIGLTLRVSMFQWLVDAVFFLPLNVDVVVIIVIIVSIVSVDLDLVVIVARVAHVGRVCSCCDCCHPRCYCCC